MFSRLLLLHDVARAIEDEGKIEDHAVESAKIARKILHEVGFPREKIDRVVYCIRVHRFRTNKKTREYRGTNIAGCG